MRANSISALIALIFSDVDLFYFSGPGFLNFAAHEPINGVSHWLCRCLTDWRFTMASFIPASDASCLRWMQNFYAVANAAPGPTGYGLTAAQLTAFNTQLTSYQTALAACEPGARSKAAVFTKNTAKAALVADARLLAKIVQGTATVTDAQKTTLGLNVRAMPQPVPVPADAPSIDVVSVDSRTVNIRLHSSTVAGKRARPAGVKGAAVFSYVGATAPSDPSAYTFQGNTSLTNFSVVFADTVEPGSVVWITAMWFNTRAQSGPAAAPVQAIIQYAYATPPGAMKMKIAA
jgi:hypothetical protein